MSLLDKLEKYGCNTKEGLERCLNKEDFYIKLLKIAVLENKVYELKDALNAKDYDKAFGLSHTLKGVYANLAITPLYDLLFSLTEDLRIRKEKDYTKEINEIIVKFEGIKKIITE
jgi:hypothetical protein